MSLPYNPPPLEDDITIVSILKKETNVWAIPILQIETGMIIILMDLKNPQKILEITETTWIQQLI